MPVDEKDGRCPVGVENATRIKDHERRITIVETAIFEIRDKLLQRPSWFVAIVITALVSALVGLLIYIAQSGLAHAAG